VGDGAPAAWTGHREPNTALAWAIIGIGLGLVAITVFQVVYWDATFNVWFFVMLVVAMFAYAAISFTSSVEMVVELADDELLYTKRERSVGRLIRETTASVDRSRMAKVVERNAGLGIRVIRIEDPDGRKLLIFPEFLEPREHDEMMKVIIEWGNQSLPNSSGLEETPMAESR